MHLSMITRRKANSDERRQGNPSKAKWPPMPSPTTSMSGRPSNQRRGLHDEEERHSARDERMANGVSTAMTHMSKEKMAP